MLQNRGISQKQHSTIITLTLGENTQHYKTGPVMRYVRVLHVNPAVTRKFPSKGSIKYSLSNVWVLLLLVINLWSNIGDVYHCN